MLSVTSVYVNSIGINYLPTGLVHNLLHLPVSRPSYLCVTDNIPPLQRDPGIMDLLFSNKQLWSCVVSQVWNCVNNHNYVVRTMIDTNYLTLKHLFYLLAPPRVLAIWLFRKHTNVNVEVNNLQFWINIIHKYTSHCNDHWFHVTGWSRN